MADLPSLTERLIVYRESRFWSSQAICAAAGDHSPAPGEAEPPCPEPGELRVFNGQLHRLIERELEGDQWEPLGPDPTGGDA